jgi:hypothetical protein
MLGLSINPSQATGDNGADLINDHEVAMELAILLAKLRDSAVEKYQFFHNKDAKCSYTKKALRVFVERDRDKLLAALRSCMNRLQLQ